MTVLQVRQDFRQDRTTGQVMFLGTQWVTKGILINCGILWKLNVPKLECHHQVYEQGNSL